jgi:hypothetical protein
MKALSQGRAPKGFAVGRYSHDAKPGKLKWEAAIDHPISRSRSLCASQGRGSVPNRRACVLRAFDYSIMWGAESVPAAIARRFAVWTEVLTLYGAPGTLSGVPRLRLGVNYEQDDIVCSRGVITETIGQSPTRQD